MTISNNCLQFHFSLETYRCKSEKATHLSVLTDRHRYEHKWSSLIPARTLKAIYLQHVRLPFSFPVLFRFSPVNLFIS